MKIEIKSTNTGEFKINPKEGGKQFEPFTKVSQTAYVHGMVDANGALEPFPVRISLDLGTKEKGFKPAYAVGFYSVGAGSFFVDRFDNLSLGRLALEPITQAQQLKAAA